jgi:hypothetical protein
MKLFYVLLVLCFVAGADVRVGDKIVNLYEYLEKLDSQEKRVAIQFIRYLIDHDKDITLPLSIEQEKDFVPDPLFSRSMSRKAWRKIVSDIIECEHQQGCCGKLKDNKKVIF